MATAPIAPAAHRFSFRLPRPLWIGVVAIVLIVIGAGLRIGMAIYRQQVATRTIREVGGVIHFRAAFSERIQRWLVDSRVLGWRRMELFDLVTEVDLRNSTGRENIRDALKCLTYVRGLRRVNLCGTRVDDAALAELENLESLQVLNLRETRIRDAGLVHLRRLRSLNRLSLFGTQVTDAGLAHIRPLTGLQELQVGRTHVTDSGIADLQRALPGLSIHK